MLDGELYRCGLCPSAPLPLCVKILLSQNRDSFPNLVNPVNPVKKVRLSLPLCLCVNFITETQRHRVFFILLCPSALKLFHRRVEIHFLILSILLILSKKWDSLCLCVKRKIRKISKSPKLPATKVISKLRELKRTSREIITATAQSILDARSPDWR